VNTPVTSPPSTQLASVITVGAAGAASVLLLHFVDPNQAGHYPVCPTYALFGVYCPGCGALRATHDLTNGDLAGAWAMNPLAVLAAPYLLWAWGAWLRRTITQRPRKFLAPGWLVLAIAIGILAFGVLRNLPGLEFLAPH
jgi:hypothetical protein